MVNISTWLKRVIKFFLNVWHTSGIFYFRQQYIIVIIILKKERTAKFCLLVYKHFFRYLEASCELVKKFPSSLVTGEVVSFLLKGNYVTLRNILRSTAIWNVKCYTHWIHVVVCRIFWTLEVCMYVVY